MKKRYILRILFLIFVFLFIVTFSSTGCRLFAPMIEGQGEMQESTDGSDMQTRAFKSALQVIAEVYPGSEPLEEYNDDSVVEEAGGLFEVKLRGSRGELWYCVLQYHEEGDIFDAVEVVEVNAEEPRGFEAEEEHTEEGDPGEEYPEELHSEEEQPPPEEQAPGEQDQQQESPQGSQQGEQQTPSETSIKERAFHAAQSDLLKDHPNAVFGVEYSDSMIKSLGTDLYQVLINYKTSSDWIYRLYLVRYDKGEDKMYIPFKKNYDELWQRAYNQVKKYFEKDYSWVSYNCLDIVFDDSYNASWQFTVDQGNPEILMVAVKFQCRHQDISQSKWYECLVYVRYDIKDDTFKDFDTGCSQV